MIPSKLIKKELVAKGIAHLYLRPLRQFREPLPGQFIMLWVPGYEEIPMSISDYSGDIIRVTVKVKGPTTNYLVNELSEGKYLGIRGPLGRGITKELVKGRGLFIVGGVGIAPIAYLIKSYHPIIKDCKLIAGFAFKDESSVVNELVSYLEVEVISEDSGGTVIDLLRKELNKINSYDYYISSGPKAVLDRSVALIPRHITGYVLAESFMKCGIGFCGSCALKDFLVCKDGTLIDSNTYRDLMS
ncbi:MAG: hypothetical protein QXO98_05030 [Sulfolobales archaeon]